MDKKIIRVFPRKTKASPDDALAYFGPPDLFVEADEIHISVTFTYDLEKAYQLYSQWKYVAPTKVDGPAMGNPGGEFTPGLYLKKGYIITSRGCPNHCWFCPVWRRSPTVKELIIHDGWIVQDDNLLACSDEHISAVFEMLREQHHEIEFTGGLEAARLKDWHISALEGLKIKQLFFAYDTPNDWDPLVEASKKLKNSKFGETKNHILRCYVLIGYPKDRMDKAEDRLQAVMKLGFMPMAMLWKNEEGDEDKLWRQFQRTWANPIIVGAKMRNMEGGNG